VTGVPIPPAPITLRPATGDDIEEMARIRDLGGWAGGASAERMALYLAGAHHPRYALQPRIVFVAEDGISIVGYIAGHLTTRFGCDGELQWLFVLPGHRGGGVASRLLDALATWFARHSSRRVCVDVEPENARARRFYLRHGARPLDSHWLVWDDISRLAEPTPSES
jgi:GNAT superfamily N-acetyltransferase